MTATCDTGPARELAAVLQRASLDMTPVVAAAAHLLAAEMITAGAESCTVCRVLSGLCARCEQLSGGALGHRELAARRGLDWWEVQP